MTWGYVALGVGTLGSGYLQSEAAGDAADAQGESDAASLAFQKQMWEQQQADQQPWIQAGTKALGQYAQMQPFQGGRDIPQYSFDPASVDVTQDIGYQFRVEQGNKALERQLAGMGGGAASGRGMKEALRFGQDMGSQEYGNAYQRAQGNALNQYQSQLGSEQTRYNRNLGEYTQQANQLASLANVGQTAQGQLAQQGAQAGSNIANTMMQAGANRGNAAIAQANIMGGTMSNLGNIGVQGLNAYNQNQMMNKMATSPTASYYGTNAGSPQTNMLYQQDMEM